MSGPVGKRLRYLGLAEESTFNMGTPPAAQFHVDIASATLDVPSNVDLSYSGGFGRGSRLRRPGFYSPSGNIVYAFDIRTIGFLLKWALGGYLFTADAGLSKHEFWAEDDLFLPSFCARLGKDLFEHVFSGCLINSLELKVEGEFCMATADIISAKDSRADLKALEDLLLPTEYPMAYYETTAKIDNEVNSSARIKSLTININNGMSAESGRTIGSRFARHIAAGAREITVQKQLMFEDMSAIQRYWGGANGPANLGGEEFPLEINMDSGEYGSLNLLAPRVVYTTLQTQGTGTDEIIQAATAKAYIGDVMLQDGVTPKETDLYAYLRNSQATMA